MRGLRDRYGNGPLHLISVIVSFAIAGYAFLEIADRPGVLSFAIYFGGAIVAHDLLAFPVYSALNLIAGRVGGTLDASPGAINYVRVPALLSAFALVVWFPLILGLADDLYLADTGHPRPDYLGRWLLLTAGLFLLSGLAYALKRRARGRGLATGPPDPRSRR